MRSLIEIIFQTLQKEKGFTSVWSSGNRIPRAILGFDLNLHGPQRVTDEVIKSDLTNYLFFNHKNPTNRRACFLVESDALIGVIIEYSEINTTALNSENSFHPYQKVRSWILTNHEESIPAALAKFLRENNYSPEIHLVEQGEEVEDILFVSQFLQLARDGEGSDIDFPKEKHAQRARYIALLNQRIKETTDDILHPKVVKYFTIFSKYTLLVLRRNTHLLAEAPLTKLEEIKELDQRDKKRIFSREITDFTSAFYFLSHKDLLILLSFTSTQDLVGNLKNKRDQMFMGLRSWEVNFEKQIDNLKEKPMSYLIWQSQRLLKNIYLHSFLGMGAELSGLFNAAAIRTDQGIDFSSWLTQKSRGWLDSNILSKVAGGALGALYSYWSGDYIFVKLTIIALLAKPLVTNMNRNLFDDKKAKLSNQSPYIPDEFTANKIMILYSTVLELVLTGEANSFIENLARVVGGIASHQIVDLMPDRYLPKESGPEVKILIKFFSALLGGEIAGKGQHALSRLYTRRAFQEAFCDDVAPLYRATDCQVKFTQSIWSRSFWYTKIDNVRLSCWRQDNLRAQADCRVGYTAGRWALDCNATKLTKRELLAPPSESTITSSGPTI